VARRSAPLHRFMVWYFHRFFCRHMNALRMAAWGMPALSPGAGPLVIYSNHPAWWDAAVYILAAHRLFPERESYAPIDAEMLQQYGVFGRIGAFGVDLNSARGAAAFLSASAEILSGSNRALWITAQGRFSDVRERPLGVKAGVARLPELAPNCTVLPLAIEYSFWLERGAEACIAFGPPIQARDLLALPRGARLQRLQEILTSVVDQLSADVQTRDPTRFQTVVAGRAGIGGVYDRWRRLMATVRGRAFDPSHERRAA
jgi:1-acyl-sn-glycerol-3-phosphate acyltransferase